MRRHLWRLPPARILHIDHRSPRLGKRDSAAYPQRMTRDKSFNTRSFGTGLDNPPSRDGGEPSLSTPSRAYQSSPPFLGHVFVTFFVTTSVTPQPPTTTAFATVGQKWVTVLPPTLPIISFYTLITSIIFIFTGNRLKSVTHVTHQWP